MKEEEPVAHKLVLPRDNELIGRVTKATGASNFMVLCSDNNERLCTIPGRLKRLFWVKEGDIVLVKPWIVQSNERGDIIWRYSLMDKEELKKRGYNVP
jgi:translation initiation factor 1A